MDSNAKTKDVLKAYFMSKELAQLTGLTPHMVTYLRQLELLVPTVPPSGPVPRPRYGKARLYTFADVLFGRSLRKLLDAGISVKEIQASVQVLKEKLGKGVRDLSNNRVTIVGRRVLFALPHERDAVDLTADGQMAFSYMLDTDQIRISASKVIATRDKKDQRRVERHQKLLRSVSRR